MKIQLFIGSSKAAKDEMAKIIANERTRGRLATYCLSIIFGLTFSIYPLLNQTTTSFWSFNFQEFKSLIKYAIPVELLLLMVTAMMSNRIRVLGFKLFPVWVDPHIEKGKLKSKPDQTFQTIFAKDTYGALKLAYQEVAPITLSIMLPGAVSFIERGFVYYNLFFILIGIFTLIFGLNTLYLSFKYKIQDIEMIKQSKIEAIRTKVDNIYRESNLMKVYDILLDEPV